MEMVRTINISGALEKAERQLDTAHSSNALIAQTNHDTAQAYTVTPSEDSSELLSSDSNSKGVSKVSSEVSNQDKSSKIKHIKVSKEDGIVHIYNRVTQSYVPELRIANA